MALLHRGITWRETCPSLAPHTGRCQQKRHCALVLNKQRPVVLEQDSSFADTSDDERPTTSGSIIGASRVLFEPSHVPTWRSELALYAPFGFMFAAFRSALWIMGIYLDQPWFRDKRVVDAYLRLLGVKVVWNHPERLPAGRHLMVSNHCSVGDLMMLFSHPALPARYIHLITSALPARVTQARHLPVILRHASPAVYDELAASTSDPSPIHLFPEGGMTNGRGMLRFSRGFTRIMQTQQQQQQQPESQPLPEDHQSGLQHERRQEKRLGSEEDGPTGHSASPSGRPLPVVPVALRVKHMAGVCSHTLTSPFLANLFWFSFSPETTLEATVLPAMTPLPGEARGAFVNRVQASISEELGVDVYDMTIQQKRQLVKQAEAKRG